MEMKCWNSVRILSKYRVLCGIFLLSMIVRVVIFDFRLRTLGTVLYDFDDKIYFGVAKIVSESSPAQIYTSETDLLWVFSIGYPLMLSFFLKALGSSELVAVATNSVCGSLASVVVYMIAKRVAHRELTAISGSLFFSYLSFFVWSNVLVLADASFAFVTLLGFYLGILLIENCKKTCLYLFYLVMGLALFLRYEAALVFLILMIVAIRLHGRQRLKRMLLRREHVKGIILMLLFFSPQLAYNQVRFGNALITGYAYWMGKPYQSPFAPGSPVVWLELTKSPQSLFRNWISIFYPQSISPVALPLFVLGLYDAIKRKRELCAIGYAWILIFLTFYSAYTPGTQARYIPLSLFPAIIIIANGLSVLEQRLRGLGYSIAVVAIGAEALFCLVNLAMNTEYMAWSWFVVSQNADSSRWFKLTSNAALSTIDYWMTWFALPVSLSPLIVKLKSFRQKKPRI